MNKIAPNIQNKYNKNRMPSSNSFLSKNNCSSQPNVSFKGVNAVAQTAQNILKESDYELLKVFSQHYGNIGERLITKINKLTSNSRILKESSRFTKEQGALFIKDKKFSKSLIENIIFPVFNLPLYIASWGLKKVQAIPALKTGAEKLYKKPLFRIPRKLNELDAKTDMLKGMFEKTNSLITNFAKDKGPRFFWICEFIDICEK